MRVLVVRVVRCRALCRRDVLGAGLAERSAMGQRVWARGEAVAGTVEGEGVAAAAWVKFRGRSGGLRCCGRPLSTSGVRW